MQGPQVASTSGKRTLWVLSMVGSFLIDRGGTRKYQGIAKNAISGMCIAIALYHIYTFVLGTYEAFTHRSIHVGSILALCFITYSFSSKKLNKFLFFDLVLALLSLSMMVYFIVNTERILYERMAMAPGSLTALDIFLGVVFILMLFEASRRAMGSILGLIALIALLYAYFGRYLGGMWYHSGFSFVQILDFTVFGLEGIFTTPVGISSTYIMLFLIFAGLIQVSGAADFFTDLAFSLAGKYRGGPAKVAVLGSAFVGSITGSAAANIAITGSVSIPMMKKYGFPNYFAGAVEAAASKGGMILPPVMAGTVFIMSEFTGVSYWNICVAAAIPALLYFLGVFVQVHLYSVKHGMVGLDASQIPPFWPTLKKGGHHFLPFVVLVGLLVRGNSPIFAALWSMPAILIVSWFRRKTRIGFKAVLKGLNAAVMMIRLIMLAVAMAGIIMGVVMYTGLGGKLMGAVAGFSGDRLFLALFIAAATSFALGLTLSMVASYILTAILIVPAVVKLGVAPLAAHLFSIYFASIAVITPPVGGAFYQAAALAEAPPFKTGWTAARLAFGGFVIPFFFVYNPSLLLIGSLTDTLISLTFTIIAIVSMAVAIEGWLFTKLRVPQRLLLIVAGFFGIFIDPIRTSIAFGLIAIVVAWLIVERKLLKSGKADYVKPPLVEDLASPVAGEAESGA